MRGADDPRPSRRLSISFGTGGNFTRSSWVRRGGKTRRRSVVTSVEDRYHVSELTAIVKTHRKKIKKTLIREDVRIDPFVLAIHVVNVHAGS